MKRSISVAVAFSLVEVTLALGIGAFCLIAVIGIIPVGIQTNRSVTSQIAATNIMAAVVSDLRAAGTCPKSQQLGISFPSGTFGATTLYFDGQGESSCDSAGLQKYQPSDPTNCTSGGSCSGSWSPPLQLQYRVTVTWSNSLWNGLNWADVKVSWPAAVLPANASGSTEMFVAFDRN